MIAICDEDPKSQLQINYLVIAFLPYLFLFYLYSSAYDGKFTQETIKGGLRISRSRSASQKPLTSLD